MVVTRWCVRERAEIHRRRWVFGESRYWSIYNGKEFLAVNEALFSYCNVRSIRYG